MKSIDVRSDAHVINGRQHIPGAFGCEILFCLLLSIGSVLAESIPDDLNRQLREILARNEPAKSNQHWKSVLAGRLIRRKRNSAVFCFSTSSSVCMAIIPAPDVIRL